VVWPFVSLSSPGSYHPTLITSAHLSLSSPNVAVFSSLSSRKLLLSVNHSVSELVLMKLLRSLTLLIVVMLMLISLMSWSMKLNDE